MVQYSPDPLDLAFAALADPTRRAIVARLARRETLTAGELAAPFSMSLPAILKHLGVMCDAGLVTREKLGRAVHCRLEPAPMRAAMAFLDRYEKFWSGRLDALAKFVEEDSPWPTSTNQASPSSVISRRRSKKSSRPGPKAKR